MYFLRAFPVNRKSLDHRLDQTVVQGRASASPTRPNCSASVEAGCHQAGSRRSCSAQSESRQALRAVVGNFHAGDLAKRAIRVSGVAHKFASIPVDLIEIRAIRREPVIARAADHGSVEPPGGAVSRNLRARGVARDFDAAAVDVVAADVAVAEVRSIDGPVVRSYGQPAQLGGHACARVDLHERADADLAVFLNGAHGASVADGKSDDKGI